MRSFGCLLLALLALCSGCSVQPQEEAAEQADGGAFVMRSLNIGEADAHILLLPDGTAALVDTGRKKHFESLDAALSAAGVTELSALILTHGHKDHVGGLEKLLKKYTVQRIYTAGLSESTFSDKTLSLIEKSGAEHIALTAGESFALGGVVCRVLAPRSSTDDENNLSLVFMAEHGGVRFLFMGDAKKEIEKELLGLNISLSADVLKTGHHGKDDASTDDFVQAVSPKYAVMTGCEEDEDGDSPGRQAMARLEQAGAELFLMRKDYLAAEFISDGVFVTANVINEWQR